MQFNPDEFNAHLAQMGQSVAWRRGYACPCINPASGQARPACPHCFGKGRMWPGEAVPCTTGVAGGNPHKQWMQTGLADPGDVVVSIPSDSPLYAIGPFDRVRFDNRTEPFSLNITKGVNEKIRFFVVSLEKVLFVQGADLVDAPLPAVNDDGTLDWSGVELPDGVTFSVTGRRRAEYIAIPDTPFDRPHHHGAALPRKVVLRRFDVYLQA